MKNTLFHQNILKHITLNEAEENELFSKAKVKSVKKKELLQRQGDLCSNLYFVSSGSLRAFNINEEGRDSSIMFAIPDWWVTDMFAFINRKPALLSIEAIEPSQLMSLDYHVLEDLYKSIPKLERFFRILFQKAYVREQLRVLDNISMSTEERYHRFLNKYPQIVEKVTQKQIASYLGVTPEFLSTIKTK